MERRQGRPVWLPDGGQPRVLERLKPQEYDEAWLQQLIHANPSVLPIWEIEPACWPAFAVCTELALGPRSADNLLVNPDGNLTLVECKLWRNPEARKEVIAQILEYAKDLAELEYADLERHVAACKDVTGKSLYEIAQSTLTETEFVDAVSRNLRRGRVLLIVAGDGITESAESLASYLQQHAGIHFTLALVQLAVFELADSGRIVVPSTLLRTTNVVRGIVEVREGVAKVGPVPLPDERPRSLSEADLFDGLDRLRPGTADRVRALIRSEPDLALRYEVKRTVIVRLPLGAVGEANVFVVYPNGDADTSTVFFAREALGTDAINRFLHDFAAAIPGAIVTSAPKAPFVRMPDGPLTIWHILDHAGPWLDAVRRFRAAVVEKQSSEV